LEIHALDSQGFDDVGNESIVFGEEAEQEMLCPDGIVVTTFGFFTGLDQRAANSIGEIVSCHGTSLS
jgi:hypothetical protein